MFGLLAEIAKPLIGLAFGSPKAIRITLMLLAISVFGTGVWYFTSERAELEIKNIELNNLNKDFKRVQEAMQVALADQALRHIAQQKRFATAISEQDILSKKLLAIQEEHRNAQSVFDRKNKTFQDMLNRRGETITKLSNAGTERVRIKWIREINDVNNRLQEGARNMRTSSQSTEPTTNTN